MPKGSPVHSVAQLRGKRIAVAQGSSADYHLLTVLNKAGLSVHDVTLVYLQPAAGLAALTSGHVDAWDIWSPFIEEGESINGAERYQLIVDLARHDNLTVRQLIGRLGGGRGHRTFAGPPERVADTIEEWSAAAAADGFNVMPAALPSGLETFVEDVIPILRKRGLFRTEYVGPTLRDHYGIARPDSQFAVAAAS